MPPPMRALVTGGAGFIGSNLVDALVARGDEVTAVDDLSTGRRENLDGALEAGAELVEADIRDASAVRDLLDRVRPAAVFHLAAQIDVRKSAARSGAGFIGSNLVDALVARGDEVTAVDDLSTGRRENLDGALEAGAELVEADIRDASAVRDLLDRVRPAAVFHLAAQIDVRKSAA